MKITLIASILVSNWIFCQKEIDTIYIEDVNKIVDQEGDLSIYIKTSDGKTHLAIYDSGFKVGNVLCYIDNVQNEMISPQEYESSIYFQLRGSLLMLVNFNLLFLSRSVYEGALPTLGDGLQYSKVIQSKTKKWAEIIKKSGAVANS